MKFLVNITERPAWIGQDGPANWQCDRQKVLTVSGCLDLKSKQLIALTWGLLFPETHAFGRSFKNPPYFDRHHGSWIPIRLMKHEIRVIKSVRFVGIGRPQPRRG